MQSVFGLAVDSGGAATDDDAPEGPVIFTYATHLPAPVLDLIFGRSPQYRLHYSVTAGFDYYMNLCECGAKFGDHFLIRPGEAFMPLYDGDADNLTAELLPVTEPFRVIAEPVSCTPGIVRILSEARS